MKYLGAQNPNEAALMRFTENGRIEVSLDRGITWTAVLNGQNRKFDIPSSEISGGV